MSSWPSRFRLSAAPGYLQDYPIEQYIRDSKIDSLYEGTTAIQGMDLYFRKIAPQPERRSDPPARADQDFAAADNGQWPGRTSGAASSRGLPTMSRRS